MKVYETTFIINPQMEDTIIDTKVNVVSDIITNNSGKILHSDHMGTRKLAYQINGLTQGYYASFIFEAGTDTPKTLDRHFKLDETYLRHLTVVYEGDALEKKQKSEEQAQPKIESKPVEAKATETKSEPVAEAKEETAPETTPEPAVETEAEVKTETQPETPAADESSHSEEDEL